MVGGWAGIYWGAFNWSVCRLTCEITDAGFSARDGRVATGRSCVEGPETGSKKPRLLFALCSRFIRLGGFFMKFRGRKAHSNRPGGLSYIDGRFGV
jgi:hypothetical protein